MSDPVSCWRVVLLGFASFESAEALLRLVEEAHLGSGSIEGQSLRSCAEQGTPAQRRALAAKAKSPDWKKILIDPKKWREDERARPRGLK